jgi:uncharacterized caspase-like protein
VASALGRTGDYDEVVPVTLREASSDAILAALRRLALGTPAAGDAARLARAGPEDAVIVYFAGHGVAAGERFHLVARDHALRTTPGPLTAASLERLVGGNTLSDLDLAAAFDGIDAGRLLLVLDTCQSGQALASEEWRQGPMNSAGLAQLAWDKGMFVLAAAQATQSAHELAGRSLGALATVLLERGLAEMAADQAPRDGLLTVREWVEHAAAEVPREVRQGPTEARRGGIIHGAGERGRQRPRLFYPRELGPDEWILTARRRLTPP